MKITQEQIEALKNNEIVFCKTTSAMQDAAREIGRDNFHFVNSSGKWQRCEANMAFDKGATYRLRHGYEPEQGMVKCELGLVGDKYRYRHPETNDWVSKYPAGYYFDGFLFADGNVGGSRVMYSVQGLTNRGYFAPYEALKDGAAHVHHATHILFTKVQS